MDRKIEFGDWQTPVGLTKKCTEYIVKNYGKDFFSTIIEPTCGTGNFVNTAIQEFKNKPHVIGFEINKQYINQAKKKINLQHGKHVTFHTADFFNTKWKDVLKECEKPVLFLGNPPWVTNSVMGVLEGKNLPLKYNIQREKGLDALMGKSNFDVSETMIITMLEQLQEEKGTVAVLCKSIVARKVVGYARKNKLNFSNAKLLPINSMKYFSAAVDACFFVFDVKNDFDYSCLAMTSLNCPKIEIITGFVGETHVRDLNLFKKHKNFFKPSQKLWRSGIKHDLSKVFELRKGSKGHINGFNELVDIEDELLFPLLKSSDIANGRLGNMSREVIITQRHIGEDTANSLKNLPKTKSYLMNYREIISHRKSSIYKKRPLFSIFGIGSYSFSPWKVCISGLYKNLKFQVVGPWKDKPVMLDDTCYFLPFDNRDEAFLVYKCLTNSISREFYESIIFWDEKRPVKKSILDLLDIEKVSMKIGIPIYLGKEKLLKAHKRGIKQKCFEKGDQLDLL